MANTVGPLSWITDTAAQRAEQATKPLLDAAQWTRSHLVEQAQEIPVPSFASHIPSLEALMGGPSTPTQQQPGAPAAQPEQSFASAIPSLASLGLQQQMPTPSGTPSAMPSNAPQTGNINSSTITQGDNGPALRPGESVGSVSFGAPSGPPSSGVMRWSEPVQVASRKYNVPPEVIMGIMDIESGGNPEARSSQGAMSLMQVMPFHYGEGENGMDPLTSIDRGTKILADNYRKYGDWDRAAAAYFGAIDDQGNITDATDATGTNGSKYVTLFRGAASKYGSGSQTYPDRGQPTAPQNIPSAPSGPPQTSDVRTYPEQAPQQAAPQDSGDVVDVISPEGAVIRGVPRHMVGEGPGKYAPSKGWQIADARQSLNADAASPLVASAVPQASPGGRRPGAGPEQAMWSPDGPAAPQAAFQMGAGRNAGGIMQRQPLADEQPYNPDEGPHESAQSTYNDPDAGGTISQPLPQQAPTTTDINAEIQDGRTTPPTPAGQWEPVTNLTQPPQSDTRAANQGAHETPPQQPSGMKPVWDALGNIVGYVQDRASNLIERIADPKPLQGQSDADRRLIESGRSIGQPLTTGVNDIVRQAEEAMGVPEGTFLQAAQDVSGVLGPEEAIQAARTATRAARSAVPEVETGMRGAMHPPNTSSAAGVAEDVISQQAPRLAAAVPEPAPVSFADVSRAADSPAQKAAREAASLPVVSRPPEDQAIREQFGRPWQEVAPARPGSMNELGDATSQIVSEGQGFRGTKERVLPEERAQIGGPVQIEPQSISLNANPGVSGSAGLVGDLGNAVGGSVTGGAAGYALPADSEEQRRQNALTGAGIGMVAGPAVGRLLPRAEGALATFGASPNYRPPTPAQQQAAAKAGAQRGAMLNRSVSAPPSAVPGRVRGVTAATDDRAGLRWAEDVLSDAAGNPRMRENDPARPSTQSRVNSGSIANERLQNELDPAIVNAGRAGLQDELPQHIEDMHAKDILNEFYNRGYQAEDAAQQARIATARANGASVATIQRMQQVGQQRADAAGIKAMQRRAGSNPEHSYSAIEARLQAQEARLTADGRWQDLQDAAQATWDHAAETRQRLVDAGLMDPADAAYYAQAYPHYVPTVPISHLEQGAGPIAAATGPTVTAGAQNLVHALGDVGTSGERLNPIVALRNYTVNAERAIQRNNVASAFAQMMDDALQASPGTMATGSTHRTFLGGGKDVTYMANGKPVTLSVPKIVADGLDAAANMSADPGTVGRWWKAAMGFVTSAMTAGRASFLPVNLLRDVNDYAVRTASKEGGPQALTGVMGTWAKQASNAVADIAMAQLTPRGVAGATTGAITGAAVGDENTTPGERIRHAVEGGVAGTFLLGANKVKATGAAREYLARGGGSGGLSAHWGAGQRWYREVLRDGGAPVKTAEDAARYVGDWLQDIATLQGVKGINERTELISRTAAMQRGDAQKLPAVESMIRGRDASYDPDRAGTVARMVNGVVPFFNATVQNGAQFTRLLKQNPVAATATIAATVAPVMLGAEAWNRSDPTRAQVYDDVPQYVKDTGIVVVLPWAGSDSRGERPNYLWIPTGVTTPFVMGMRRAMENLPGLEPTAGAVGDRPDASTAERWANTLATVVQTFSPVRGDSASSVLSNFIPQGVKQGVELGINKDLYRGNPIVTDPADERASAFSRGISDTANAAGRAVGSDFLQNVHPSGVEHLVNALPAYADIAKGASDLVAPSGFKQAEDRPVQNEPFVGGVAQRFVRDTGGANIQRSQDEALSDGVREVIQDAGMRTGDIDLSLPASYKQAPLTRDEQLRWQNVFNAELSRAIGQVRRSDQWRNPTTREKAVREAVATAKQQAAERARLPNDQQIENRIRRQQSMKAS